MTNIETFESKKLEVLELIKQLANNGCNGTLDYQKATIKLNMMLDEAIKLIVILREVEDE